MSAKKKCGIPSRSLGKCDAEWGHDGEMHVSFSDGFYAREHLVLHRLRQAVKKRDEKKRAAQSIGRPKRKP